MMLISREQFAQTGQEREDKQNVLSSTRKARWQDTYTFKGNLRKGQPAKRRRGGSDYEFVIRTI